MINRTELRKVPSEEKALLQLVAIGPQMFESISGNSSVTTELLNLIAARVLCIPCPRR